MRARVISLLRVRVVACGVLAWMPVFHPERARGVVTPLFPFASHVLPVALGAVCLCVMIVLDWRGTRSRCALLVADPIG